MTYYMHFTTNHRKVINSQKQSGFFGPPCMSPASPGVFSMTAPKNLSNKQASSLSNQCDVTSAHRYRIMTDRPT